jgi:hypothetical protein
MQKKFILGVFLLTLISCKDIKRGGFSESERNYTPIQPITEDSEARMSDLFFRLNNLKRKDITDTLIHLTKEILGEELTSALVEKNFETDISEKLFQLLDLFNSKTIQLDSIKQVGKISTETYKQFSSATIVSNFEEFIKFENPVYYQAIVGEYKLDYKIRLLISPNWFETGKYIFVKKSTTDFDYSYKTEYNQFLTITIDLTINDFKNQKKEFYQKNIQDSCRAYTISDMLAIKAMKQDLD